MLTIDPSTEARTRFERLEGKPLMRCAWRRVLMVHYALPVDVLQPLIPFEVDTFDGFGWVSLVPFGLHDLRVGRGRLGQWVASPLRDHRFLNVRTYVRVNSERAVYFMTEWVSHRLAVQLGPALFGLPYVYGDLDYRHDHERGRLAGTARGAGGRYRFVYDAAIDEHADFAPCAAGTLDAFLMERYVAYTALSRKRLLMRRGLFRIWHEPWPQVRVDVTVHDDNLVKLVGNWFSRATRVSANYSPGVEDVWIGWPRAAG